MSSTLKVQCTLSIFYLDNEIDGEAFCELTQEDLKKLFPIDNLEEVVRLHLL